MNAAKTNDLLSSMEAYYNLRAPIYDQSSGYDQPEVVAMMKEVITYMQENLEGRNVLELSCGPCFWTSQFALTAKSILATDINASVLDEAHKKPLDWEKIALMVADAYALPDFGRNFDAAVSVDAFCHVPKSKMQDYLTGLHNKLEPEAVVMFCTQSSTPETWTGQFDEEGNHMQIRTLPDGSKFPIIKNFPDEEEIRSTFKPFAKDLTIKRFDGLTRYVIHYRVGTQDLTL